MKQIYAIALFFIPFYCISQLYIQPRENRESYVYVVDELLYVTKQIHLTPNNNTEIASLYLRKEAQLLQGDENAPNTGLGVISVFQEGKASAYTYNYWSSPVDDLPGKNIFEEVIFEPQSRLLSSYVNFTSHLNGQARPLSISNKWIYKLHGSSYGEWIFLGNRFDLEPGEGFTMKGVEGVNSFVTIHGISNNPGNEQRHDFRGKPNNGLIVLQVRKGEVRLIGNPYPSALNLNKFLLDNQNITGIAYFWDSSLVSSHYLNDYQGGYGAYSPALGSNGYVPAVFYKYSSNGEAVEHTGISGEHYGRRYLPVAQGFIIEGLENGPLFFRNEYRAYQKETLGISEFKSSSPALKNSDAVPFVKFNFKFNNTYTRQLLLAFHPASTKDVDRAMDARNLMPLATDAGWMMGYLEYLINVQPYQENDKIPLFLNISETTPVDISLAEIDILQKKIFLHDDEKNEYYDLSVPASLIVQKGKYMERFFFTFENPRSYTEDIPVPSEVSIFQNNREKRTEIRTTPKFKVEQIRLFDITGRRIIDIKGESQKLEYQFSTENFSNGYYIVKIKAPDGAVISKKVIISN